MAQERNDSRLCFVPEVLKRVLFRLFERILTGSPHRFTLVFMYFIALHLMCAKLLNLADNVDLLVRANAFHLLQVWLYKAIQVIVACNIDQNVPFFFLFIRVWKFLMIAMLFFFMRCFCLGRLRNKCFCYKVHRKTPPKRKQKKLGGRCVSRGSFCVLLYYWSGTMLCV